MRKRNYILILLVFAVLFSNAQQGGLYSNFLQHQVVYNSAYAGVVPGKQFNLNYRNQWTSFEGAPKTFAVSGYGTMRKKPNIAIGGLVFSEKYGLIDYTSFYGMFSYRLKINSFSFMNFGVGVGAAQYSVRTFNARPYDKDDAMIASGVLNALAFDANAGIYLQVKHFFLGFSNQHMSNSKIRWDNSLGKLTPHFYLYAGYDITFDKKKTWVLQPAALLRFNRPVPYQMEGNLKLIFKEAIWLGLNYRHESTAGASLGVTIDKHFSISYCYDYTTSKISSYVGGTHEVFLAYQIPFVKKKSKSEQVQDEDQEELNKVEEKNNTIKGKKTNTQPQEEKK
jgi:type IX secretion system PorP/SprF family membrane protein